MLHVRLRLIRDEVVRLAPERVFEVGCGIGVLRRELQRSLPRLQYWGCDVSQSAVALANDARIVQVDLNAEPLPFAGERFDCVVGSGVLEYLGDVAGLLAGIRERLAAGGYLIVSYFNMNHLSRRAVRWLGRRPQRNPTWVNEHSFGALRGMLRRAGFTIRREIPSNLGLRGSPSVGHERWTAPALRTLRRMPLVATFAHQMIFVCRA